MTASCRWSLVKLAPLVIGQVGHCWSSGTIGIGHVSTVGRAGTSAHLSWLFGLEEMLRYQRILERKDG